jgi:hypothetical protein
MQQQVMIPMQMEWYNTIQTTKSAFVAMVLLFSRPPLLGPYWARREQPSIADLVCDASSPPRTKPPTRAAPAASNGKGFLNLRPVKFLFFKKKNLAFFFW